MKIYLFNILLFFTFSFYAQRGETGDKTFADRFPEEVINKYTR